MHLFVIDSTFRCPYVEAIAELKNDIDPRHDGVVLKDFSVKPQNLSARYIRMVAENPGPCPSWHLGAGGKSWIFADEWIVE
ncbi:MAG: hypothetical protein PHQ65_03780 [Bacteroidales bacterium]|nr:hypothetical protein [Bacteroidales bacterium]MDD3664362.1 hypothetical protein [Bacteroidales bacterium]